MIKIQELRALTDGELQEKIVSLKKELFDFRGKSSGDKIEKSHHIREARKEIARILTILKEKEKRP